MARSEQTEEIEDAKPPRVPQAKQDPLELQLRVHQLPSRSDGPYWYG